MLTTFRHEHVTDPRRAVAVEVGDALQPDFHPQLKTLHWGGEASFSVRLVDDAPHQAAEVTHHGGGIVEWRKPHRAAKWYPLDPADGLLEDGGHEFEVHLLEPPVSNVLRFTVRAKRLRFFYQSRDGLEDDASMPDAVHGSYAVYHADRAGNFDDVHYRAGKAFHILRPHAVDDTGLRAWCRLEIPEDGNGEATITVPEAFLEMAAYPVVVDPTFGYTSIGGTLASVNLSLGAIGQLHSPHTAAGGDTVTDIDVYGDGSTTVAVAVYSIVAGLPSSRLAAQVVVGPFTGTPQWWTASVSQALVGGTAYDAAVGDTSGVNVDLYRDTGSGAERSLATVGTLPASWSSSGTSASLYSIYATYAVGSGAPAQPLIAPSAAAQRAASW